MKKLIVVFVFAVLFSSCKKDLKFKTMNFYKKTTMPCKQGCPQIKVSVPFAEPKNEVSDNINNKILSVVHSIVSFEEPAKKFTDYNSVLSNFIAEYEKMQTENPDDIFGWEADVKGAKIYHSKKILNIEIAHHSYTGGAHGSSGLRSILINSETGKSIANKDLFFDELKFKAFAEKQFRTKFKIPKDSGINSTALMFEDDKFQLPNNYFFNKNGLLLYYNNYEIASYAQGPQELLLSYEILKPYLKVK
jgi:hypothetical protein